MPATVLIALLYNNLAANVCLYKGSILKIEKTKKCVPTVSLTLLKGSSHVRSTAEK